MDVCLRTTPAPLIKNVCNRGSQIEIKLWRMGVSYGWRDIDALKGFLNVNTCAASHAIFKFAIFAKSESASLRTTHSLEFVTLFELV
jgi:hypothetical protein